jgi:hypothetical protein
MVFLQLFTPSVIFDATFPKEGLEVGSKSFSEESLECGITAYK